MRVNASAAMFITTKPDLGKLNLMNASEKVDFELGMAANPNKRIEVLLLVYLPNMIN